MYHVLSLSLSLSLSLKALKEDEKLRLRIVSLASLLRNAQATNGVPHTIGSPVLHMGQVSHVTSSNLLVCGKCTTNVWSCVIQLVLVHHMSSPLCMYQTRASMCMCNQN